MSSCRIAQQATTPFGFETISELPGIEGRLAEGVRKRLSEPAGTGSANVWEAEADGQHYFVAVGQMSNKDWPWQLVVTVPRTGQLEPASKSIFILIGAIGFGHLACLCHRLRNEPGHRRADGPIAHECAAGPQRKY